MNLQQQGRAPLTLTVMALCPPWQEMIGTVLEVCKVYLRLDQPNAALEHYTAALQAHPGDASLLLGIARVYDGVGDSDKALQVGLGLYRVCVIAFASRLLPVGCGGCGCGRLGDACARPWVLGQCSRHGMWFRQIAHTSAACMCTSLYHSFTTACSCAAVHPLSCQLLS